MNRNFAGNVGTENAPSVGGITDVSLPKADIPADPLLTDRQVAVMMSCGRSTIWRWASDGIVPQPIKIGGVSRWRKSTIAAVIERAEADVVAA